MMCTNWEKRKAMLETSGWKRGISYGEDAYYSTRKFRSFSIDTLKRMTDSEFLDMLDGMLHR